MHNVQGHSLLLAVDRHQSPLFEAFNRVVFTPYGVRSGQSQPQGRVGFNGQLLESSDGTYLLGNGFRAYSPALMRFLSVDPLSPFDKGGINAYVYCAGDPINRQDPSGRHFININFSQAGSTVNAATTVASVSASTAASVVNATQQAVIGAANVLSFAGALHTLGSTEPISATLRVAATLGMAGPITSSIAVGLNLGGAGLVAPIISTVGTVMTGAGAALRVVDGIRTNTAGTYLRQMGNGVMRVLRIPKEAEGLKQGISV